jgi:DNA-binding transcriptional LysR family regulator
MRWLIPRLHRFQAAHPGVEVRLSASDQPVDFSRSSFEVAIRVGAGDWPREAVVTPLFDEQIGPVCAPSLLRASSVKSPKDLEGLPFLHTKTRPHAWRDWAHRVDWKPKSFPGQHFEHFYFLLEAAVAGLGVAIAPLQLVEEDLRAGRLVAPLGFVPSDQVYVALRRQGRSHKAAAFVAWLKAEADVARRTSRARRR